MSLCIATAFFRNTFYPILLLLCSLGSQAANEPAGLIRGKVTTNDGKPAAWVTIQVKGLKKSTATNEEGLFILKNMAAGTYELEISLTGYTTTTQTVTVSNNEASVVSIVLQMSGRQLDEVVVTSGRKRFSRPSSDYVARMPLKGIENPQVYSSISSELLKEQAIVSFDDALKNAPGIDKLWTSTGRGSDGAAYFSLRGFSVQPTMVNGIAGISNGGLDPANIERIEVIKGPSGTLFGSSLISFGGLININTKRPYDSLGGELSYTGGAFGLSRITADINTPLNKDKSLLLRVNGAYHYENSFQDAGFKKTQFLAPSVSYKVSDRLSFFINTEFYSAESTNPLMLFLNRTRKLVATSPDMLKVDYKRSFTSNDVTIKTPTVNLYGQINYKLSDKWVSQTNLARSNRKSDGYYQYVMYILPGDSMLHRYVSNQNSSSLTTDIQQNFIGDFTIGRMRNRVVAGLDFLNIETNNASSAYITFDTVNAVHPDAKYTMLTRAALDTKFAQAGAPTKTTISSYTYSAYASDVLNITDHLLLMLSLRVDRFDNKGTYNQRTAASTGAYAQTAFSPKLGMLYAIIKDRLSVFGNYMNGFRNVAAVTQPDGSVSNFTPQQANQWEGGVKADLFNHKLTATLSYYDIYVTDVTRTDPFKAGYTIQDGNVSSKGFEADIIVSPLPGLNIIAGFSHNDSKNDKTDSTTNGLRANSAGPVNLANAWISYSIINGVLKGLGAGIGGNYASENVITNNKVTGSFALPSYTILNAGIFYNTRTFRLGLKADNLTDKKYWKGWSTVEPQALRRVSASITFKF